MKLIIGGGLAGLLAAHAWPSASIIEAMPEPRESHKALLRFRSDAVAKLTGIEFRRVKVHKGIYLDGEFVKPNIRAANLYCRKVMHERLMGDRSIWNIDAAERYIAPDNFYDQLIDSVDSRINWNMKFDFKNRLTTEPIINTTPLPIVLAQLSIPNTEVFQRSEIIVQRYKIPNCDLYQTIYFPEEHTSIYRASITGDTLIVEFVGEQEDSDYDWEMLQDAFGINLSEAEFLGKVDQKYGKIEPINDSKRKQILFQLTHDHKIFSLGRFATWRNILLDDVVDDIVVIKRLAKAASYDLKKAV